MSLLSRVLGLRSLPSGEPARHQRSSRRLAVEPPEARSLMSATLAISDTWADEGNSGVTYLTFTVRLSEASAEPVTVNYATADGTAKAKGGHKSDYQAASGTLTFAPGETTKTITVAVNGDKHTEDDEYFTVNLSAASGAGIADGQGVGLIRNDDYRDPGSHPHCPHNYCLP